MKNMIKQLMLFTFFVAVFPVGASHAKQDSHANLVSQGQVFVKDTGNEIIQLIRSSKTLEQKRASFKSILDRHFAMDAIGRFVLGRYWRIASAAQKQDFLHAFEKSVVNSYTAQFDQYKNETLTVSKGNVSKDGAIWIESQVNSETRAPLKVLWKLYASGGSFKIYDIYVNNISMSITYRSEYASVIQRHGGQLQALIDALNENKVAPPKVA